MKKTIALVGAKLVKKPQFERKNHKIFLQQPNINNIMPKSRNPVDEIIHVAGGQSYLPVQKQVEGTARRV